MFILRSIFALSLVVLILPADARQQQELTRTASTAYRYVTTLCDRNPSTCATGSSYWILFKKKSATGFQFAMDFAATQTAANTEGSEGASGSEGTESDDQTILDDLTRLNRGTLKPRDLTPAWRG